jgi:hypothetical protein
MISTVAPVAASNSAGRPPTELDRVVDALRGQGLAGEEAPSPSHGCATTGPGRPAPWRRTPGEVADAGGRDPERRRRLDEPTTVDLLADELTVQVVYRGLSHERLPCLPTVPAPSPGTSLGRSLDRSCSEAGAELPVPGPGRDVAAGGLRPRGRLGGRGAVDDLASRVETPTTSSPARRCGRR